MKHLISFLLNQWLWSMTWGLYQAPFSAVCMALLFYVSEGKKFLVSLFLSVTAHGISFLLFNGLFALVMWLGLIDAGEPTQMVAYCGAYAALFLALMYSFFQMLYFSVISRFYGLHLFHVLLIVLLSNGMAAVLVYKLSPHLCIP